MLTLTLWEIIKHIAECSKLILKAYVCYQGCYAQLCQMYTVQRYLHYKPHSFEYWDDFCLMTEYFDAKQIFIMFRYMEVS